MGSWRSKGFATTAWPVILLSIVGCSNDDETATERASMSGHGGTASSGAPSASTGGREGHGGLSHQGTAGEISTAPPLAARYDPTQLVAPVTTAVVERMRSIAQRTPRQDNVFMKVGASETVSPNLLNCFAGNPNTHYLLDLDGREELMPTIEYFRAGDAAGSTPFDRATEAAIVGRTASWAIGSAPSPLDTEIAATDPRFAFVNYGTNDMGYGVTHLSALFSFYESMSTLLDQLEQKGIIPIVSGLNPRTDSATAALWVPTYDAVTRGLAEQRQLPYLSLYLLARDLPDSGLVSDGIHGSAYLSGGGYQPCVFTTEALEYNYNIRNLESVRLLDAVKRVVIDGERPPNEGTRGYTGTGTYDDPIVIDQLPFTHSASTSRLSQRVLDRYPSCDAGPDESGPEVVYTWTLETETPVRILVLDREGVDVDLHLLGEEASAESCIERNDRAIQRLLGAGTYHLVLDTFVDGVEMGGDYLLTVLRCEPGDEDCE